MPEEEGEPVSSRIDFRGINSKMVGFSEEFKEARDHLLAKDDSGSWLLITGMAGIGKTTLAKKLFDDPLVQTHFKLRVWVKVGRKCEFREILRCILSQVDPNTYGQILTQGNDNKVVGVLEERLKGKKCLVVLDDVWEWDMTQIMDNLPQENVQILFTSRLANTDYPILRIRCVKREESEKLLGEKVFGKVGFPPHLEKLGEKIAKKCERLPLMIVTVVELLSREEKTTKYWTEVAEKQHNSVFVEAYNKIYEVLSPSYDYLPQYLKMIFLYFGAFLPYINIIPQRAFNLLGVEGFLELGVKQTSQDFTVKCAEKLDRYYHLLMFRFNPKSWFKKEVCRVHSCLQHL